MLIRNSVSADRCRTLSSLRARISNELGLLRVFLNVFTGCPICLSTAEVVITSARARSNMILASGLLSVSRTIVAAVTSIDLRTRDTRERNRLVASCRRTTLIGLFLVRPVSRNVAARIRRNNELRRSGLSSLRHDLNGRTVSLVLGVGVKHFDGDIRCRGSYIIPNFDMFITEVAGPAGRVFVRYLVVLCSNSWGL